MSLGDIALVFAKMGLLSFGGGFTIIAELQRELVSVRGVITDAQFSYAYALGQGTPGPGLLFIIPIGFRLAGPLGAVVAILSFVLPTLALVLVVARQWERLSGSPWVRALNGVLVPMTVGLLGAGLYTIGRPIVGEPLSVAAATLAAAAVASRRIDPTLVILCGGSLGFLRLL